MVNLQGTTHACNYALKWVKFKLFIDTVNEIPINVFSPRGKYSMEAQLKVPLA